jgi:hypothetical protein
MVDGRRAEGPMARTVASGWASGRCGVASRPTSVRHGTARGGKAVSFVTETINRSGEAGTTRGRAGSGPRSGDVIRRGKLTP